MLDQKLKELPILISYGAPAEDQQRLEEMVEKYSHDPLAITLLHEFYSHLPEALEETVSHFSLLENHNGVLLFLLNTADHGYYYVVNKDKATLVGMLPEQPHEDILHFLGYNSADEFSKKYPEPQVLPPHNLHYIGKEVCPACFTPSGQEHIFGCPVEVCPWCDGQLTSCNCRFDQLKVEEVRSQQQLDTFQSLVKKKGRIVYDAAQNPGFLSDQE